MCVKVYESFNGGLFMSIIKKVDKKAIEQILDEERELYENEVIKQEDENLKSIESSSYSSVFDFEE